ncbi:MAG TPA: hypothetical protein VJ788_01195 [Gemmatimonadota bacterium]|nr:hypothetical protein [Gemmatimonadota bacterium]
MNVRVDENRFLSVTCEPEERVVFDRQEKKYHLLRQSAARLWDEIGEGGAFDLAAVTSDADDPIAQLVDAGLISIEPDQSVPRGLTRRVWLTRTGKASAAALVLPLVASIATPQLVLGQDLSPVDVNEEQTDLEKTAEELSELTPRERRRLRRQQRNQGGEEEITTPTTPTTTRRRRQGTTVEQPTVSTPATTTTQEEETTSALADFFRRRN